MPQGVALSSCKSKSQPTQPAGIGNTGSGASVVHPCTETEDYPNPELPPTFLTNPS